ncbi:sulfatase-like hydrolase/transferase, partial [Akkermansiaceae bacterium]|nr:sulfatase-like hydrolase/transferase [Akkermansiaceae bacterium]
MKPTVLTLLATCLASFAETTKPNIVYILADDMGYGDVQILNPKRGKIATPHMDQVAKDGMIFTDAHTTSSVCTPTRYSILTGRYNWRTKLQEHVLDGYGLPLIPTTRTTVPSFLNENGYTTAMIGKWHLGLNIATTDGNVAKPA